MPNVDDHGLEVLKKAARNIGVTPKTDYALQVVDTPDVNQTGLSSLITIGIGATVELKVGATRKTDRQYINIQAKGTGIKFGFTSPATEFDAFKDQLIVLPCGPSLAVYLTNTSGAVRQVGIGEI